MPTKNRVGCDERSNFGESPSSNGLTPHGKSPALGLGQLESPAAELLLKDSVLLAEKFDDCILLASNPSGQGCDEDLPRLKDDCHPGIVAFGQRIGQLPGTE